MRTIRVGFEIGVPDDVTDDQVLSVMTKLVDVGLDDARSTVDDDELEGKDEAEIALWINIGPVELLSRPDSTGE